MTKVLNKVIQTPQDSARLSSIFKYQPNLAWDMVEQQCNIYTNPNVDVEEINKLSSMYCRVVLKLNELQDPRQKYFNNKMQKLMAEPFVIRCYTDSSQNKNPDVNLSQKRKELEQKLSIENQKHNNHAFQHLLQKQNEKEKKLKEKISQVIVEHEKNLENRLQLRSMKKLLVSPIKKNSEDIALSSSSSGNPELTTPKKLQNSRELNLQDLSGPRNQRSGNYSSLRPQSQRWAAYKYGNQSIDSSDSEDQYHIQKMLRQQKIYMAKKKQSQLWQSSEQKRKK